MLKRVLFRVAAVAVAVALGGSARADFVVDDFTNPNPSTGLVSLPTAAPSTAVDGPTVIGAATRTLTVTQSANLLGASGATQYLIGTTPVGGRLAIATAPLATANATVLYTYAASQNLAAGGTSLQFTFASADFGVPYSVQISDGTNTATQSGTTSTGAGVYSFSTGSFAGVNLSAVTSILLSLNRNLQIGPSSDVVSADFSLSDVRVLTPTAPPAIPAPPAAVLVLAALPVLGLARARRMLPV